MGEKSIPDRGQGTHSPSINRNHSGTATPNSEEGAGSCEFAGAILNPVDTEGGPQEYLVLKLERKSSAGATNVPGEAAPEDKAATHKPAEPEDQSHDAAAPTSPVLSQMSMPGTWLMNHRRLPGMLGQMTSDIMGRAQLDQVRLTQL